MHKIAFLFSGQGAQKPGMMQDLFENDSNARAVFETADKALGRSISGLCFNGTEEELKQTTNTQPCVLAADLAAWAALSARGVTADAFAGFSLGEYAALTAAGVLSLTEAFRLIRIRADAMTEAVAGIEGGMLAVIGQDAEKVQNLCQEVSEFVTPVNFNCPGQIVVSGLKAGIEQLIARCKNEKIRAMPLATSAPFHCELMKPAVNKLEAAFNAIDMKDANLPVYMNVDGKPAQNSGMIREKVLRQTYSPVRWEQTLQQLWQDGVDTFIELGPGSTLTGFVKRTLKEARYFHVESMADLDSVITALKED